MFYLIQTEYLFDEVYCIKYHNLYSKLEKGQSKVKNIKMKLQSPPYLSKNQWKEVQNAWPKYFDKKMSIEVRSDRQHIVQMAVAHLISGMKHNLDMISISNHYVEGDYDASQKLWHTVRSSPEYKAEVRKEKMRKKLQSTLNGSIWN